MRKPLKMGGRLFAVEEIPDTSCPAIVDTDA
jgi:hypothetical protein